MRKECGAYFELLDVEEDPHGGHNAYSAYAPKEAVCRKCGRMKPDWYPKPPPVFHLWQEEEPLDQFWHPVAIVHEALFEVLKPFWPEAVTSKCTAKPDSPSQAGNRYVSVSVPRVYEASVRFPGGSVQQCGRCGRWASYLPYPCPHPDNRYLVLRPEQDELGALLSPHPSLFVSGAIRRQIDKLGIGMPTWTTVPVFTEPLPENRLPEDPA